MSILGQAWKNITLETAKQFCLRKTKSTEEKQQCPKGRVCLHKMIEPTLGCLTKICLYLPRQFSHVAIFLMCQGPGLSRCIII